ncbi:hypothetical protein Q8G35_19355 [Peribacillus simplex]|uniref:Uncharacterized protein n=2 Tax=Peribacillus TaxID=2675229 RepID=A0AA90P470_9BACI|nr:MULTISPECIES: hypothetical protein [Peribacillus]MDP1420477.1 hypothetical protein [Peribacillus simplex]MDP1453309.1 hypothetical protein [Peribacillus frigoritolerans]
MAIEEQKDKRVSVFDRIIGFMPKFYVIGTILIFVYTLVAMAHLGIQTLKKPEETVEPVTPVSQGFEHTLISLIIEPIVTSEFYQIIFNTLFLYLVWILLFLLAPIAFYRLKHFKFFNIEIEIEKQDAAVYEVFSMSSSKMKFAAYLTSEEYQLEISEEIANSKDFKAPLIYTLDCAVDFYSDQLGLSFTYDIYTLNQFKKAKLPKSIKAMLDKSIQTGDPCITNKSNSDSEYYKNFLLHYFENMDGKFVTVLNSYQTEFDTFDKSLIKILQNVIYDYYLQYNYIYEASEKLEKNEAISDNN